jgi:RNA polymerase sigma factor for flagellar operon FliA
MTMTLKSSEDQKHLWQKWISERDPQAGDTIMRQHMPLVQYHVHRISVGLPQGVSKDELKSFGMLGLFDALEKFDSSRDLKFDTYASFRIRGAILDGLRKEDWLPRSVREKSKKIESTTEQLEQRLMRTVTAKEIADQLSMTEEEVLSTVNESFFANVLSIDESNSDEDHKEGSGFTVKDKKTSTPEEHLVKEELYKELANHIKGLNEKEQLVISLFYDEELTLTEIGQVMELSTSRISQIHSKAIFKLRKILNQV